MMMNSPLEAYPTGTFFGHHPKFPGVTHYIISSILVYSSKEVVEMKFALSVGSLLPLIAFLLSISIVLPSFVSAGNIMFY